MKTQHTPGPWRSRLAFNQGEPWEYVIDSGAQLIASTVDCNNTSEANARLIAAAPETAKQRDELLEICIILLNRSDESEEMKPLAERARAAIAKAEGRA